MSRKSKIQQTPVDEEMFDRVECTQLANGSSMVVLVGCEDVRARSGAADVNNAKQQSVGWCNQYDSAVQS